MDIQDFDYLGKHILTQPPQPPQKPPATFISLPRKVRDCIYDYYFTQFFSKTEKAQNDTTNFTARITSASSYNPHIQLLFTTRQIHAEASSLFYTTHFNKLFFAPEMPRAAYTLIKSIAQRHTQSCYGEIRVQPNVHAPTGLSIVSGYRNLDEGSLLGDGYFVSVDFLELGLGGCDGTMDQAHVLLAASKYEKDKGFASSSSTNVERYLCGSDWHLRVTTSSQREGLEEEGGGDGGGGEGVVLSGYIGVLNCLCSQTGGQETNLPKLRIRVKRKVLKNIGSRFREIP